MNLSDEAVLSAPTIAEILFSNRKTIAAAKIFLKWLKNNGGQVSRNAVSQFADALQAGKFSVDGQPFRYSRRNFYLTVLRTLVSAGFVQRNVPVWDSKNKRTQFVYARNIFDIPQKPPSVGFWRLAYYICRKFNSYMQEEAPTILPGPRS